mgnify:CR=1 FL=1
MIDGYGRPLPPPPHGYGYAQMPNGQAALMPLSGAYGGLSQQGAVLQGYANPAPPTEPPPPGPSASAVIHQPNIHELGGKNPDKPRWFRMAYFPTSPLYSTDPEVGYMPRFYSGGLLNSAAGTEQPVQVQIDQPVRVIAINASAVDSQGGALPVGLDPLDSFLFRLENGTGDKLHTAARLASTVCGRGWMPGEIGGTGYTIDGGASVFLNITPLRANLRIDVTLVCMEIRGPRNFVGGR